VSTFAGRGLAQLEDQMCDFGVNGLSDNTSPDRVDALVWEISELFAPRPMPRVRML
jgi:phage terminase large subunit-like protein